MSTIGYCLSACSLNYKAEVAGPDDCFVPNIRLTSEGEGLARALVIAGQPDDCFVPNIRLTSERGGLAQVFVTAEQTLYRPKKERA